MSGAGQLQVLCLDHFNWDGLTVELTHENTYTGGTWLKTSSYTQTLVVNANRALGSGTVTIDAGKLSFAVSQDYGLDTPPAIIVNGGGVMQTAAALGLDVEYTASGFLSCADGHWGGNHTFSGEVEIAAGANVALSGSRDSHLTLTGTVSGAGSLSTANTDFGYYNYTGNLALNHAGNTYTGGTEVASGGLRVQADQALGTGTVGVTCSGVATGWLLGGLSVEAQQSYAAGAQPLVRIDPGGAVYVAAGTGVGLNLDVTLNGGELSGSALGSQDSELAGLVALTADSYLGGAYGSLEVSGTITGSHKLTKQSNSSSHPGDNNRNLSGPITLSNPANDFDGLDVLYGTVKTAAGGALGVGTVNVSAAPASADAAAVPKGARLMTVTNDGALDNPGQTVNIDAGAVLDIGTTELAGNQADVHVMPGGALAVSGGVTTFSFGGAGKNINLYKGAIVDEDVALTRAEVDALALGSGFGVYKGYDRTVTVTDEMHFGDSGTNTYRGIAVMNGGNTLTFSGTANDDAAAGVSFYAQAGSELRVSSAARFVGAPSLTLEGGGLTRVYASTASLPASIVYNGNGYGCHFQDANTLNGRTLTVNGGYVYGEVADALDGTVNVNSGGIVYVNKEYSAGNFTINDGGGIYVNDFADPFSSPTANWTVNSGATIGIYHGGPWDVGRTFSDPLPGAGDASVLVQCADSNYTHFTLTLANGVVLSEDTRLGLMADAHGIPGNGTLLAGGDITLDAGESSGRMTSLAGRTLRVNSKVDFGTNKLIVGAPGEMSTMKNYARGFVDLPQTGNVYLTNAGNAMGEIDVQSGVLQAYLPASGPVLTLGGADTDIHIAEGAALEIVSQEGYSAPPSTPSSAAPARSASPTST